MAAISPEQGGVKLMDQLPRRIGQIPAVPKQLAPETFGRGALAKAGITGFRRSVRGQTRGPVCGTGTCFECRVTVNGRGHCHSCLTLCQNGMEVWTDE